MTVSVKTAPPVLPQSDIEQFRGKQAETLDGEKQRLRKVTKEFESFFMYEILKNMRRTVKETSLNEGGPFSGGLGKDVFTQMFDMEVSKKMATGNQGSIADLLYKSMEGLVEAQYGTKQPDAKEPGGLKPLEQSEGARFRPVPTDTPSELKRQPTDELLPISLTKPKSVSDPILARFGRYIDEAAQEQRLDSALIASVIKVESGGNPKAESAVGAKGLMQLMDTTAAEVGVRDSLNPRENIRGGARYLRRMIDRFGDLRTGLAAYNAGPGAVARHGGVPPFAETEQYVEKVLSHYRDASR